MVSNKAIGVWLVKERRINIDLRIELAAVLSVGINNRGTNLYLFGLIWVSERESNSHPLSERCMRSQHSLNIVSYL